MQRQKIDLESVKLLKEMRDFLELVFKADSGVIIADRSDEARNLISKVDSFLKEPKPLLPHGFPIGVQKVYSCAYSEYEVDYMDKTLWCNCKESGKRTCDCGRYTYTQQFCPFFQRGELKGKWDISEAELDDARKYIDRQSR